MLYDAGLDIDRDLKLRVPCMKVRRRMLPIIHENHNTIETQDGWYEVRWLSPARDFAEHREFHCLQVFPAAHGCIQIVEQEDDADADQHT